MNSDGPFLSLWVDDEGVEARGGARDAFYGLPAIDKLTVAQLWLLERSVRFVEERSGYMKTLQLLEATLPGARWAAEQLTRATHRQRESRFRNERLAQVTRLHLIAHELVPSENDCVSTSLTLWWLARVLGYDAEIHLGVRNFGGVFEAHAWVSVDGEVVNDIRNEYLDYRELPARHA